MFIAFDGPDNTGKTSDAIKLSNDGAHNYNVTKRMHAEMRKDIEGQPDLPVTYDRIDWFTHMVYRLALPEGDWNDDRPRTVFAMPDTHLVIKLHHPDLADFMAEEVVQTPIVRVNPMYFYFADFFTGLNEEKDFGLFKTISIMEVKHDQQAGTFSQALAAFSSPAISHIDAVSRGINSPESLLELLRDDDHQRI